MNGLLRHPKPLNRAQLAFCWLVMQLDRIPRYGRTYTLNRDTRKINNKPEWRYMSYGNWGMNLLIKMGLFGRYIDYMEEAE